jgi:hypothetical protein
MVDNLKAKFIPKDSQINLLGKLKYMRLKGLSVKE